MSVLDANDERSMLFMRESNELLLWLVDRAIKFDETVDDFPLVASAFVDIIFAATAGFIATAQSCDIRMDDDEALKRRLEEIMNWHRRVMVTGADSTKGALQ